VCAKTLDGRKEARKADPLVFTVTLRMETTLLLCSYIIPVAIATGIIAT